MIFSVILVTIAVMFFSLSLAILYITVIPKQFSEMRRFPDDPITATIFYAKIAYSTLVAFLWVLGVSYLTQPTEVKVVAFLYAYIGCAIAAFINSSLWFAIYNIQSKKPLQYGHKQTE